MKRRGQPELPGAEQKFKRRAKITKTASALTHVEIDTVEDDATLPTNLKSVRSFLNQALTRFNQSLDAETYNRFEGLKDTLMVDGEGQWDPDIRAQRERKKRPCLTLNRFKPMIAHVANEQRMSRPAIQIDPVGGGADPESAQIRQGIVRYVEVLSHAETVYDNAFERMIEKGWSWYRVVTDWESALSHRQVIKIEGFTNDFCVFGDPNAEDPTRRDQKYAFIVYDMPRGEYVSTYKNSKIISATEFQGIGDIAPNWLTPDSIRVVEYYYMAEEEMYTVKLKGGDGVWEDEIEQRAGLWWYKSQLEQYDGGTLEAEALDEVPVEYDLQGKLKRRKSVRSKPQWALINAVEILDGDMGDDAEKNTSGRDVAGKYIPLVMVSGQERFINGKRRLSGMVRSNRDAQRMYNYSISAFVEMIALAPKSPFIAAAGQIEKYKPIWDSLNLENWPYLPYDPVTVNQQNVPPPQRQVVEQPVGPLIQAIREFDNDLKIGFNIFDPTLGNAKSEQSGRAVTALQSRSDSANYNWIDNMRRAQVFTGEIILSMIPVIFDAAQIVTIVRPNDQHEEVQINQEFDYKDPRTGAVKQKNYDMAVGKYSCSVSLGQYASRRQQAVQSLTDIAKNVPGVALPLLPLILDNMDTPMAKEAAAIVKRLQPAEMQEPGSPEQMQKEMKALMQQHEMLVDALERANKVIEMKELDGATKKAVAVIGAQAQIAIAAAKLGSAEGINRLTLEYKRITENADRISDHILAGTQQQHEKDMTELEPETVGA